MSSSRSLPPVNLPTVRKSRSFRQLAKRTVRRLIGEHAYGILGKIRNREISRVERLEEFAAGTEYPSVSQILELHNSEVAVTLSLGVQYAYTSFIEGDIVEFGTASGVTARTIARAMLAGEVARPKKKLYLFDSFVGLPAATSAVDQNSYEVRMGIWAPGACRFLTKDELFRFCSAVIGSERVVIHEGWFSDTVPRLLPTQKFAFVHFDGDLYQSTIDAIGGLLKIGAISNGAIICFDDWNCSQADPNFGERRAWAELTTQYNIKFSDWRSYSMMGKAFFIHDYMRPMDL
jgi:O-methyltransferase